jgi:hypothetical protein
MTTPEDFIASQAEAIENDGKALTCQPRDPEELRAIILDEITRHLGDALATHEENIASNRGNREAPTAAIETPVAGTCLALHMFGGWLKAMKIEEPRKAKGRWVWLMARRG